MRCGERVKERRIDLLLYGSRLELYQKLHVTSPVVSRLQVQVRH